ncbi:MAG TPA: hypothetical protein VK911_04715 [Vicinamibacterales bacterium]|nr:hypothetical protein [Vicinamibacterales bacterium]
MGRPGTTSDRQLIGRKVWVPQMSRSGAVLFAAAFRSIGVDSEVCPDSDAETLELGGRHTSGEECLPARVTLGSFLQVARRPGFDPAKTALFMPTADGPCRFGQYAPYLSMVLRQIGLGEVMVLAPSSSDGYASLGDKANELQRTALRALISADLLRKMLHRTRPHETNPGDTDACYAGAIKTVERAIEQPGLDGKARLEAIAAALGEARDAFHRVPARFSRRRPLIGVVGEIFCRLTPFTNDSVIRRVEEAGGECTLAPVIEWVWYTNFEHQKRLRQEGRRFSLAMGVAKIKDRIQQSDEHRLHQVFAEDLHGYEEPHVDRVLRYSQPYLPHTGALGEMTLSVGKAVHHYHQGCDGILDISPFTCMNGIVTEAVYPRVSADCDGIPIRNFYFDGTQTHLQRDIAIFMELARSYQARKKVGRVYPVSFPPAPLPAPAGA